MKANRRAGRRGFDFLLDKGRLVNTWCQEISRFPSPWPFPRVQLLVLGRSWEHQEKGQEVLLRASGDAASLLECAGLGFPPSPDLPRGISAPKFPTEPRVGEQRMCWSTLSLKHRQAKPQQGCCVQPRVGWHVPEPGQPGPGAIICPQNAHFLQLSPIKRSPGPVPVTRPYVPAHR